MASDGNGDPVNNAWGAGVLGPLPAELWAEASLNPDWADRLAVGNAVLFLLLNTAW